MNREFASESGSRVKLGQVAEFNLGAMRVSPARRQIRVNGEIRTLEPRVMQVLVALAEARPNVVPRDEIVDACWGGVAVGDDAINRCIVSLRRLAREFDPEPFTIETIPRVGYALREVGGLQGEVVAAPTAGRHWLIPAAMIAAIALAALWLWHPWRSDGVSIAVSSATKSADSQDLARDLTAKLGMLRSVSEGSVRLLDLGGTAADFGFQVDSSVRASGIEANLVFLNDQREILWSHTFRQPSANLSDVEQQLASTAGKVVECAVETHSQGTGLKTETIKAYLNDCAAFADANEWSIGDLAASLDQVTRTAPRFWPAWRKSLIAEAMLLNMTSRAPDCMASAKKVVAAAVRANPRLPEIDIVRAAMLPPSSVAERSRLIEGAWKKAPNDPDVVAFYSGNLAQVGRINEAVDVARRAVQLDPLSPTNRENIVMDLAFAGRIAEAEEELQQAERLWPGSLSILSTRYLYYLRVGDPREAIRLIDSGRQMPSSAPYQRLFLEARANPTPANVDRALADARSKYAAHWEWIYHTAQVLGQFGREEELFRILLNWNHPEGVDYITTIIFRPALHNFRRDPRFMRVAQRTGLLDYWRKSGKWPDLCDEPDLPYNCKAEAAKIAAAS